MTKSLFFTALLATFIFFAGAPAHAQFGAWGGQQHYQPWELSGSCRDQWGQNLNWGQCYGSGGRVLGPHVTLVILRDGRWEATVNRGGSAGYGQYGGYQGYPQGRSQGYPHGYSGGQRGDPVDQAAARAVQGIFNYLGARAVDDLVYDTPRNRARYRQQPQYPQGYGGQQEGPKCFDSSGRLFYCELQRRQ